MSRRRPSVPPVLPGFTHVRLLGSGGFADVFLYEQNMPRRQVAVKVLLAEVVTEHVRRMFQAEANLMAQLSSHPGILTVYQASIAADGRPYLVMELCSSQLAARFRREVIPVAEVLRVGVQIGSALETAHRHGVLHRDVKPSNILTTAYGHPVLSDFGIAASLSAVDSTATVGFSIPWSAPEVLLDHTTGSVTSEVWSLAATLFTLLAGRSPFEVPGGANASSDLISRITRTRPAPIMREDVSHGLQRVLTRALSRDPTHRQQSMLELIRDLQRVEAELGLVPTQADVAMDDWALASMGDPVDRTVIRPLAATSPIAVGARRRRRLTVPAATSLITVDSPAQPPSDDVRRSVRRTRVLAAGLVVVSLGVIALGASATVIAIRGADRELPRVTDLQAVPRGTEVTFTWGDPGISTKDSFQVALADGSTAFQRGTEFTVVAASGDRVCITVRVVRDGRVGPASDEKCAEVAAG